MAYAFTFDASACTGCKACQIACKDKNNLPVGVLWRRVYEVSGGSWVKQGDAWATDVFAYYLSIACNHCAHPKCAGVCPTDAFVTREDGIVYINESKCMGCGYCNWACPYDAPQYNPHVGQMAKCNFCYDDLEAGAPPACVSACPMRALDFVEISDLEIESRELAGRERLELWTIPGAEHPFPLPVYSRTEPRLAIQPHAGMDNNLEKMVAGQGEKNFYGRDEFPLLVFTLLAQMAAGITIFSLGFPPTAFSLLSIGLLLALGGLFSCLHLGYVKNAWRAVLHLKKSWLSREILMAGLFGVSWLAWVALSVLKADAGSLDNAQRFSALLGAGMVFSMARVYRLRAVPAWDTWRTETAFFLAAGTLGGLATALLTGESLPAGVGAFILAAEALLALSGKDQISKPAGRLRLGLVAGCLAGAGGMFLLPDLGWGWIAIPTFLLALLEEGIGRWMFYALRSQ